MRTDPDTGLPQQIADSIRGELGKGSSENGLGQTTDKFRSGEYFVLGYSGKPAFLYALFSEVSPDRGLAGVDYAPWPRKRFPGLVVLEVNGKRSRVPLSGKLTLIHVDSGGNVKSGPYKGAFERFRDEIKPAYQHGVQTGSGRALGAVMKAMLEPEASVAESKSTQHQRHSRTNDPSHD
jgi:hypothetical protein